MTKRLKKGICFLLLLTLTLTACGKEDTVSTPAQETIQAFREEAENSSKTPSELAEAILFRELLPFDGISQEIEPGALNGFSGEITGFREGAVFAPVIGAIPFIGYIFRMEDGQDAAAFLAKLESQADLRWNVCTQADEMAGGISGDLVCFVMSPLDFED